MMGQSPASDFRANGESGRPRDGKFPGDSGLLAKGRHPTISGSVPSIGLKRRHPFMLVTKLLIELPALTGPWRRGRWEW